MIGKHVLLYFGSFNPVHNGHLSIAKHAMVHTTAEELWFVVSPQSPDKQYISYDNYLLRINYLREVLEHIDDPTLSICTIEAELPTPSYTFTTLLELYEKYPDYRFSLLIGSDNYFNIHKWKSVNNILSNHAIYVYPRKGQVITFKNIEALETPYEVHLLNAPLLDISSSEIRERIRHGLPIDHLVPIRIDDTKTPNK